MAAKRGRQSQQKAARSWSSCPSLRSMAEMMPMLSFGVDDRAAAATRVVSSANGDDIGVHTWPQPSPCGHPLPHSTKVAQELLRVPAFDKLIVVDGNARAELAQLRMQRG